MICFPPIIHMADCIHRLDTDITPSSCPSCTINLSNSSRFPSITSNLAKPLPFFIFFTLTLPIFMPSEVIALLMSAKTPGESLQITWSCTGLKLTFFTLLSQVTSTTRESSDSERYLHPVLCTFIPLPFVMTPLMLSPRRGEQFLQKLKRMFRSRPTTIPFELLEGRSLKTDCDLFFKTWLSLSFLVAESDLSLFTVVMAAEPKISVMTFFSDS
mmetsp:Transcript_16788/g.25334  ORF Transcript_16788/g.25334 Transcript_16788/m.25334 type:complete len:214 (-) Transcript_16788:1213-1854(-)